MGISGSGKGTQTALLMKAVPRAVNISTGDGLRRVMRRENLVGRYIRDIIKRGGLVPYWAAAHIWLSGFVQRLRGGENLVFDGAPRRVEEARMMDDFMANVGRELPVAIYVKLSKREAFKRLLARGRFDDNPRAIRERFNFFTINVQPVIRYYRQRKRLVVVDGDKSVAEVWRDIKKALRL